MIDSFSTEPIIAICPKLCCRDVLSEKRESVTKHHGDYLFYTYLYDIPTPEVTWFYLVKDL